VRVRRDRRIIVAAVLAALFAVLFLWVGLADGIGTPSIPSGDIALVQDAPDGNISTEDFNAALKQTALGQGITKVPKPSDPQYATLRDAAMSNLITQRWVAGEAAERGITASDTDIQSYIKQNIGGPSDFAKAAKQAGFTTSQAKDQIRLIVLGQDLQKEVVGTTPPSVPQDTVQNFYDANKAQFTQPETRDVREIVNKDKGQIDQAKAALEKDHSASSWKAVASKFSTDKATKSNGGLRQGVAQGQSEPALDQQIFAAPTGQLVGPFKGQAGYYVIEVDKVTPASVTPLSKVETQIKQQLAQGLQQEKVSQVQASITGKWTSRTFCASGYVVQQCSNFTPPSTATQGAPPVQSSGAVNPGHAATFPGQAPAALPQGPQYPAAKQPAVLGPGGAPTLPPGTAPPSGAPPSGAAPPSGTAPPASGG
jgi:parvulin-like peptidyl-prolyl isomerase